MHNRRQPITIETLQFGQRLGKNPTRGKSFQILLLLHCHQMFNKEIHSPSISTMSQRSKHWLVKLPNQYLVKYEQESQIWSSFKSYFMVKVNNSQHNPIHQQSIVKVLQKVRSTCQRMWPFFQNNPKQGGKPFPNSSSIRLSSNVQKRDTLFQFNNSESKVKNFDYPTIH